MKPNCKAPINISFKSKVNFLILYIEIVEKKSKAIKLLIRLMYDESTPLKPYLIIPKENDQRMDTIIR